jgi:hypothetical protein
MSNDEAAILKSDLTTVSSLQKVLSMMMKFEGEDLDESGRDLKSDVSPPIVNITKQNVNLLLAKGNDDDDDTSIPPHLSTVTPIPSPAATSTREQKSYKNRHSKIDEQFSVPSNVEHVQVPLIVTTQSTLTSQQIMHQQEQRPQPPSKKMKLTNVTVNDQNSPVYKFVLRQGQAIEDLLKEIFQNYTDVEHQSSTTTEIPSQSLFRPQTSLNLSAPGPSLKSLDDNSKLEHTTQNGVTFTNVKISNFPIMESNMRPMPTRMPSSWIKNTSEPPVLQTATSIVINQSDDEGHNYNQVLSECPKNTSFQCVSTGRCIPSYLRCNFIKECPDNSDEAKYVHNFAFL